MALNIYQQMMQGRGAPNSAQAIGQGLRMAGAAVDRYGEQMTEAQKLKLMLQEMTQKRTQALLDARRAEVEMGILEEEQEEKKRVRDTRQKGLEAIFKKRVAETPPGMTPSQDDLDLLDLDPLDQVSTMPPPPSMDASLGMGMSDATPQPLRYDPGPAPAPVGGPPGMLPEQGIRGGQGMGGHPSLNPAERLERFPTRDEQLRTAFEHELIDGGEYFKQTDPAKSPDFIIGKLAAQSGYNLARDEDRREFQYKLAMLLEQGRNERAAQQDRSKPKTEWGMPVKQMGETEVGHISQMRMTASNIAEMKGVLRSISPLLRGPVAGRVAAKNAYSRAAQELENLVIATTPGLARGVYGERGVLTDEDRKEYQRLLPAMKKDPAVAAYILQKLEGQIQKAWRSSIYTMQDVGIATGHLDPDAAFDVIANPPRRTRTAPPPGGGGQVDTATSDMDIIRQIKAQRKGQGGRK